LSDAVPGDEFRDSFYILRFETFVHGLQDLLGSALESEAYFAAASLGHKGKELVIDLGGIEDAAPLNIEAVVNDKAAQFFA